MEEPVKNPETDTRTQSAEQSKQQSATIYDFEEEKRKRANG